MSPSLSAAKALLLISIFPILSYGAPTTSKQVDRDISSLNWKNCTADFLGVLYESVGVIPPNLECATYTVPIDWDQPSAGTVDLALNRIPAAAPSERIGTLIVNPGGPGGSAIELVYGYALGLAYLSPEIYGHFDIGS